MQSAARPSTPPPFHATVCMRLVLVEPDIPQNAGALLRLGACLGVAVDIVGPCGFVLDDRRLRRAGMDYLEAAKLTVHESWAAYRRAAAGRLLLLSARGDVSYAAWAFRPDDNLLLGSESAGAPPPVQAAADARLAVPMRAGLRSLNVALAAAMVLGEALRQTWGFPGTER